jgi:alcohol dehydrogenase YqhD (iron-dependent ADH family)
MLGWLRAHHDLHARRIAELGRRLFRLPDGEQAASIAAQTSLCLQEWLHRVRAPTTLADLGIPARDIPRIADNTRGLARIWRLRDYPPERVAAILHLCR